MPPEVVPSSEETDEDKAKWAKELQHHARTYQLDPWLLAERVSGVASQPPQFRDAEANVCKRRLLTW